MLEHLDQIGWSALRHAYGPAMDVPDMIRALASPDAEERDEALHAAYGNIFHQGTRYTATPAAIPFLIEIASQPGSDVIELLALIRHCVAGYFSPVHGPRTASGPIWGEPTEPMADYGETREILDACELAAEPVVPLCLRLLAHPDASVRSQACYALAALRRFADRYEVVPRLRDQMARETDASVRAFGALGLTHLLPMADTAVLEQIFREDRDAIVRVLAGMGCVRRSSRASELSTRLVEWMSDEDLATAYEALSVGSNGLSGDLAALMTALDRDSLRAALPTLVEKLRTARDFEVVGILEAALAVVFGDEPVPASLDADQRLVLETLANNQPFWSIGNALSILMDRDLPASREQMAELLGVVVEHDPVEAARINARAMARFGWQRAVEEWNKVLALAPDDVEGNVQLGMMFANARRLPEALPLLRRALAAGATGTDRSRVWFGIGLCLADENPEEALSAFTQAERDLPAGSRDIARQNQIAMLQKLGRAEEALALVESSPASTEQLYNLGLAQVKAGKFPECIANIKMVLAAEPEHALAHYTIACAYALSGDADNAFASIRRTVECDPSLGDDMHADSDFASLRNDPRFLEIFGENN